MVPGQQYSQICQNKGRVSGFLGSLKISSCEEGRLNDTQNLKCEARRFQNCLFLKIEDFEDLDN